MRRVRICKEIRYLFDQNLGFSSCIYVHWQANYSQPLDNDLTQINHKLQNKL